MAHEVLSLHVGQAGVQFGHTCWEIYCLEHDINPDGTHKKPEDSDKDTDKFETFFMWGSKGTLIPRGIFVDLDPDSVDNLNLSKNRKIFPHVFTGKGDATATYARAYHVIEEYILDASVARARKIMERCDNFEGTILTSAVGGGTGSGLATRIMQRVASDYGGKTKMAFTIYPGDMTSGSVVEPYNALLATKSLMEDIDVAVLFNNDSLAEICRKKLNVDFPDHMEYNQVIGQVVSSVTGTMRFDGAMNKLLREFPTNLTPYPKLRFTVGSLAPIEPASKGAKATSVSSMVSSCLDSANQTFPWKIKGAEYITCALLCRGKINENGLNKAVSSVKRNKKVKFAAKMEPADIKVSLVEQPCEVPKKGIMQKEASTMCMVANNTGTGDYWKKLLRKAETMFEKKAYVHWYVAEGMEELEFREASETVRSLIDEYKALS